jgi:hypothetical protein
MHPVVLLLAAAASADVPPPVRPDKDPVLQWNEVALQAIKADRTPPPMAARNLAIVHAAIYDAVNAIDRTHAAYHVEAKAPAGASPEAAAAAAAHRALVHLYPKLSERFDAALDESLRAVPDGPAKDDGVALGQTVADKMLAWRADDGSAKKPPRVSEDAPGCWKPTPPDYKPALYPLWSEVTPFALKKADQFRAGPPPALTDAAYTAAFKEVKSLGGSDSRARTAEQTVVAWFWADGEGTVTPPGHWNRIAQAAARDRGDTLAENARLFALLNVALADAGIACWECKFKYGFWRPVTAIRQANDDDNPDTLADPDWAPLLKTPPFPTYVSGHSTFSGAAAAVLADFFGDDARVQTTSDAFPGMTRKFASFSDAAAEAGRSRIYGGIHFEFDNQEGLAMGREVGRYCGKNILVPLPRVVPIPDERGR